MSILSSLDKCSDALLQANATLHASLTSLTEGTEDYPRLLRVLANERYYELVSQDDILQAQLEIQREVEPQIKELIQLAEDGLRDLQKRERNLHELVENRKQQQEAQALQQQEKKAALPIITSGPKSTVETAKLKARLMALQIERENLHKEVERVQADLEAKKATQAG